MLNLFFAKKINTLKVLLFLIFIQLFFSNNIKANDGLNLDSIINYANSFKNDTDKINAYFKYDDYIYRYSPKLDSALNKLIVFLCDSNLKKAQLSDKEKNNFYNQKARSFNNLGLYFKNVANIDSALHYFDLCLEIYKKIDNRSRIAPTYTNICNTYLITDDYENALKYIYKSRKINIELNNQKALIGNLNSIGLIYKNQQKLDKALSLFEEALKISEELNDSNNISVIYGNIGNILLFNKKYIEANKNFFKTVDYQKNIRNLKLISASYANISNCYSKLNDYKLAKEYALKSLKIKEKINDNLGISIIYNLLGAIEKEGFNNCESAIAYGEKSFEIAKELKSLTHQRDAAKLLFDCYEHLNQYKNAYNYHLIYTQTNDSILKKENYKNLLDIEYKYNYKIKLEKDSINNLKLKELAEIELSKKDVIIKAKQNQQFALFGGFLLVIIFSGIVYNRYKITQKQKTTIEKQKSILDTAHHELQEKSKEITDSINYAKRIQEAILPSAQLLKQSLRNGFVLYQPKAIVSGDFYWMENISLKNSPVENFRDGSGGEAENIIYFAAADCTGHGVPGAMVSVVCSNALSKSILEENKTLPGEVLDKTREIVVKRFSKNNEDVKDGMDISLCSLKLSKSSKLSESYATLQWAGANNPLWLIRPTVNGRETKQSLQNEQIASLPVVARNDEYEIIEYKPNKQPIGKTDNPQPFTTHTIELQKDDTIYIFTDGFADQFGGEKGKKMMYKPFKELLLSIQEKTMDEQKIMLEQHFKNWKGSLEQVDDVCVIGVRV